MIQFIVPGVPVAQPRQRSRIAKGKGGQFIQNYTPAKAPVNDYKATVKLALREAYQGQPLEGPLHLGVSFYMPRPKSMVWKKRPMPREWHTKKPDTDNVVKAVKDALSGLAYRDDSQVCFELIQKKYASGDEQPHTLIVIDELDEVSTL